MKTLAATLLSLGLILFSSNANAWFFFILPGSVTSKIGDALTGSEGENCVGPDAKVGDPITFNGVPMTIKSLSGTSTRCANAAMPIRALLVPVTANPSTPSTVSTPSLQENTTEGKLDLPLGWESQTLKEAMKVNGIVLHARNQTLDAALFMSVIKRSGITDMTTFADTRRATQAANLREPSPSGVSLALINGLPAWRFSVSGKLTTGQQMTYLQTIYESEKEVVVLNIWTSQGNFEKYRDHFIKIADSLTGLRPPVDADKDTRAKSNLKDDQAKSLASDLEAARVLEEEAKRSTEAKKIAALPPQVDFNAEALKSSRILGCPALEAKVVGIEKENILYSIACSDSRVLLLSCDPAGLCLQKK